MSGISRLVRRRKNGGKAPTEARRVAILVPSGDLVHSAFAFSLANMVKHTLLSQPENLEAFAVQGFSTSILPYSREELARYALENNATHTLWIDSDMEFGSNMLVNFLKHDEPIIGINATSRRPPYRNTAQIDVGQELATSEHSTGLEKVYRMGFGVAWVATEVFRNLEEPWFDFVWHGDRRVFQGEDHHFVMKAKEAGYELFIDHDISKNVNHQGTFGFNPVIKGLAVTGGLETP